MLFLGKISNTELGWSAIVIGNHVTFTFLRYTSYRSI